MGAAADDGLNYPGRHAIDQRPTAKASSVRDRLTASFVDLVEQGKIASVRFDTSETRLRPTPVEGLYLHGCRRQEYSDDNYTLSPVHHLERRKS